MSGAIIPVFSYRILEQEQKSQNRSRSHRHTPRQHEFQRITLNQSNPSIPSQRFCQIKSTESAPCRRMRVFAMSLKLSGKAKALSLTAHRRGLSNHTTCTATFGRSSQRQPLCLSFHIVSESRIQDSILIQFEPSYQKFGRILARSNPSNAVDQFDVFFTRFYYGFNLALLSFRLTLFLSYSLVYFLVPIISSYRLFPL